jgi:hypothetical protein
MSTKSKKRKARRAFLKQANQIRTIVDEEFHCEVVRLVEKEPRYMGRIEIQPIELELQQQQLDKEIFEDIAAADGALFISREEKPYLKVE